MKKAGQGIKSIAKYKWEIGLLVLVIAVLSIFVSGKEGYHMDELLSFELSNGEFNPWIVPTQPEGRLAKFMREEIEGESLGETFSNLVRIVEDTLTNRGNSILANYKADVYEEPVWISRQQFHNYITVESGDDFNYLSVYFNVKDDNHPPIHFMLLHTVSSLFQGKVIPWMGCFINIVAIVGCCILLMRMGRELCGSRWYGLAVAGLYGLSTGAIATTLLIRMYGVVTFLCVAVLYLHLRKWKLGNWREKNKLLILVTMLGFWTQYFFLFYMIGVALVTVIALAGKKQWKPLLYYIRSMCVAGVIGVCVFPFAISDVFASDRGVEALGNLAQGLNGYGQRLAAFGQILAQRLPGGVVGAVLLVGLAVAAVVVTVRTRSSKALQESHALITGLLAVPFILYFLLAAKMAPYMVDRYIMPIFPIGVLLLVYLAHRVKVPEKAVMATTAVLCLISVFTYDGEYLFKGYEEQTRLAQEYRNLPCVCVYEGYGFYKNLIEFTEYEQTLLVTKEELANRTTDEILDNSKQIIVMVKTEIDRQELSKLLSEKYGLRLEKELLAEGVHQDSIWLCTR